MASCVATLKTFKALGAYCAPTSFRSPSLAIQATRSSLSAGHHKVDDVSRYLKKMGWSSLPAMGQRLHTFSTDNGEVWVPSQLLVQSLFGFNAPLAKHLFTSTPLACFCHPVHEEENAKVMFPDMSLFPDAYRRVPVAVERLSWLSHSRSAYRAWVSVFRNALDGRIDCTMPV